MSSQHTPGPWQRDDKGRTISSVKGLVCECFSGPVGVEECDANERLIAAAPDLLAAAKEVKGHIAGRLPTRGYLEDNDASRAALATLLRAIAKATGEQA